jgi:hypothetical protein
MDCRAALGAPAFAAALGAFTPAYAAHPMLTEDTGTQDVGRFELELGAQAARDGDVRAFQIGPQLSYGVFATVDFIIRPTWQAVRGADAQGGGREQGIGDTTLDVKWRFVQEQALSFAIRAGTDVPTGDEARALGAGKPSPHAMLIATLDAAPLTFDANVAYARNPLADGRHNLVAFNAALVWAANAHLRFTAETAAASNPVPDRSTWPAVARFGAIATVASWLDVDVGYQTRLNRAAPTTVVLAGATLRW